MERFCIEIIDTTRDVVSCYKPNIAFFEAHGPDGLRALERVLDKIPADIPVIMDAKRGDIGNTSLFFARAVFEHFGADAVTVNPLMGRDSVEPFVSFADKGVFLLCATSNPGAADFLLRDGLYRQIAEFGATLRRENPGVGLVTGATRPEMLAEIRTLFPDGPFLVPGVGAQGGSARDVLHQGGSDLVINVSRSVLYADSTEEFAVAARREVLKLNAEIQAAREATGT